TSCSRQRKRGGSGPLAPTLPRLFRKYRRMNILSLLAHPRSTSFCHAVSERARAALGAQGHQLTHHDLYADGFEPRLAADEAWSIGDSVEQTLARSADPLLQRYRQ